MINYKGGIYCEKDSKKRREKRKKTCNKYSKNYENVSLTPGADETQLNFAYYSKTAETPKVKIATNKDMTDAKEVEGTQTEAVQIDGEQYYSNKATVEGLKENTTYYLSWRLIYKRRTFRRS